jgi:hypothetical protein
MYLFPLTFLPFYLRISFFSVKPRTNLRTKKIIWEGKKKKKRTQLLQTSDTKKHSKAKPKKGTALR